MAERPILFSGAMVRAILDGRKTQTRRVVKPQPPHWQDLMMMSPPYGQSGDRLWVRETWRPGSWRDDGRVAIDYAASRELTNTPWLYPDNFEDLWPKWTDELLRAGSVPDANGIHHWAPGQAPLRWRPSIHMPRWACRILLEITDVRVELLKAISRADATAEGAHGGHGSIPGYGYNSTPIEHFQHIWETINGVGSWDANPWVWVIEFRRVA